MSAINATNSAVLLQLLIGLLDRATQIGQLISNARNEGRDVSADELEDLLALDTVARRALQTAINAARNEQATRKPA
jgi:hypothetical protein